MSADDQPGKLALWVAEEILRTIYGDDLKGCLISLDSIATIIQRGLQPAETPDAELLELYERLTEAVHLLSTPPNVGKVADPNELRSLLGERLDAIHVLTTKTIDTTARAKSERARNDSAAS